MNSSKQKSPNYLDHIRELTDKVREQEKVASEKCKEIERLVKPIYAKNGSTTLVEYRTTIKQILALLGNDISFESH